MRIAWERLEGRDGHIVGRELLARLYREETGCGLPEILYSAHGKPYFPENDLFFSISHTKKHVFCCLSRKNIGIDAEETDRAVSPALAEKMLSDTEKQRYYAAPDRSAAMLRLWVLKESYAKLTGRGIGNYLKNTDFDPEDPRIREIDGCYVAIMEKEN